MFKNIYWQSLFVWLTIAVITIFFGAFREIVFIPATGLDGNVARALLLPVAFIYIYLLTYLFFKKTKISFTLDDSIKIGGLWLIMTIIFEFSFGGLIMGNSIEKLIADYNPLEGKTWAFFLVFMFVAPYFVAKFNFKK